MKASPDTESSPSKRTGWRRLLRYCAYALAGLLVLGLIGFGALVAINWNDEELTPETQAWLTEPANPVPDAQNAWLAMQAVGFEKQSGPNVGRRFIAAMAQLSPYNEIGRKPNNPPESTEQLMERSKHLFDAQFGPLWEANSAIFTLCWKSGEWKGAFVRMMAQRKIVEDILRTNHAVLQRYYAAIALPGFFDLSPDNYDLLYATTVNNNDITAATCLARMDLSLRLLDGDQSAREPLQRHLRYWITQTTQSHSQTGLMFASNQIKFDLDWATELLAKAPASQPALLASTPLWQDLAGRSPDDLLSKTFPAELRSFRYLIAQDNPRQLTFKTNAALNFRRQLMTESDDTHKQSCDWASWRMAYNFSGKILSCIAATDMKPFRGRLQTMLDMTTQLNQKLAGLPTTHAGKP